MNPTDQHCDPHAREALYSAIQALEAAQRSGQAGAMAEAHLGLARCYKGLGAPAAALAMLSHGLACAPGTDQRVELLCERIALLADLAQAQQAQAQGQGRAAQEEARDHIFEAAGLAARVADASWEVTVLLQLSDMLNRLGDHEDAAELQSRAVQLMAGDESGGCDAAQGPGSGPWDDR